MTDFTESGSQMEEKRFAGPAELCNSEGAETGTRAPYAIIWKDGEELELY